MSFAHITGTIDFIHWGLFISGTYNLYTHFTFTFHIISHYISLEITSTKICTHSSLKDGGHPRRGEIVGSGRPPTDFDTTRCESLKLQLLLYSRLFDSCPQYHYWHLPFHIITCQTLSLYHLCTYRMLFRSIVSFIIGECSIVLTMDFPTSEDTYLNLCIFIVGGCSVVAPWVPLLLQSLHLIYYLGQGYSHELQCYFFFRSTLISFSRGHEFTLALVHL